MNTGFNRFSGGAGSVLFMVVSVMSVIIMIVCSVYFSEVSSGRENQREYDRRQAYLYSASVADIIKARFSENGELKKTADTLEQGESVSAVSREYELEVSLKRLEDENGLKTFDIIVTAEYNGEKAVTHTVFHDCGDD